MKKLTRFDWSVLIALGLTAIIVVIARLFKPSFPRFPLANIGIALVIPILTAVFLHLKNRVLQLIFGILWLLMLPNATYLFLRFEDLPASALTGLAGTMLLTFFIGLLTFGLGGLPFYQFVRGKTRLVRVIWTIIFSLVIAYGTVLGKWGHLQSSAVLLNPLHTLSMGIKTLSHVQLIGILVLALFFLITAIVEGLNLIKIRKQTK